MRMAVRTTASSATKLWWHRRMMRHSKIADLPARSATAPFQKDAEERRRPALAKETKKSKQMGEAVRNKAVSVQKRAFSGQNSQAKRSNVKVATSLRLRRKLS